MTLGDLIRKAKEVGDQFNTHEIPLYDGSSDEIFDIELWVGRDYEGELYVRMIVK